ncbi:MAG: ACP phosphodiesterase [Lacibacter sp.]|jgi:acyl carrier protein phosphodiesterase
MNYLAHAYLSFNNPAVLVGNLISDFVKGKQRFDFPEAIQKGIALHRAIDAFTDSHAATREAKALFRPAYRLYSAAFVDVVYDHFLANDEQHFTDTTLAHFAACTYAILQQHHHWLPTGFQGIFQYMQHQNWLYHYRYPEGTIKSFGGVVRRARYLTDSKEAALLFQEHYPTLRQCYNAFFPDLLAFAKEQYAFLTL